MQEKSSRMVAGEAKWNTNIEEQIEFSYAERKR